MYFCWYILKTTTLSTRWYRSGLLVLSTTTSHTCAYKQLYLGWNSKWHHPGKLIKTMDMQFYWVHDLIHQGHLNVFWKLGAHNMSGYFTKHHPPHHRLQMRPVYLQCSRNENSSSVRVGYFSQKNIQMHDWIKNQISKVKHLQIGKMGTHEQTHGHNYRMTGGSNNQQLKWIEVPPTSHLLLILIGQD